MIIDCHGHYTTAPRQHEGWRREQIEAHGAGKPPPPRPAMTDDEIRETIAGGQLKVQRERGTALTIFSPRAAGMGHHLGDATTSDAWASASCNPTHHTTGSHYLNGDTAGFNQLMTSSVFKDFPTIKFIIPHGGGAVPYHWGRYRGLAQDAKLGLLSDVVLNNVFFDTCVYHLPGQELLAKVIPVDNILFASDMIGAFLGIDAGTCHHYDDTKRYIDQLPVSAAYKARIFE